MAGIVKIEYKIGGEDAVVRSFKTILQASQQTGREQIKVAREVASVRTRAAKSVNENGSTRAAASNAAKEIRDAKRVADTKIAENKRVLDRLESDAKAATRKREAGERAADERSTKRAVMDIERRDQAEARAERKKTAVRQMEARKGSTISTAMEFAKIDDINSRRGRVRSAVGDAVKRGASSGIGTVQAGAGIVGGYLGTQTVLDAGRSQLDLGKRQALLQNTTGDKTTDFVGMSKSISNVVGEDAGSVMGGLEKIAGKSGAEGIAQAKDQMLELAKVAKGAGVSMEDLGDVTATLINRGIKSKDLVKNVEALVQQGKDGAVEFKDLATMLDASSGALIKFKMDATGRSMSAGGLSQIARTYGKSSAAESTNAVVDLARDLGGKADDIKKLSGVEVGVGGKVGRAQLRDVNTLLPEIIEGIAKKGNAGKLEGQGGIFTGNSTTISTPLMQAFTLGLKKNDSGRLQIAGEGETADIKGKEAVKALISQFEDTLPKAGASIEAFANVMATQSEQTSVAMNKLKNDLGDKLSPIIAKASPQIVKMITAFGEITAWALTNPFKAVGALMFASMAQSLLASAGGSLIDKLLSKAIPSLAVTAGTVNVVGGSGTGGLAALGSGGGTMAGLNATTVGGAVVAGAAGYAAGSAFTGSLDKQIEGANSSRQNAGIKALSLASGGLKDPAKMAEAKALLGNLQGEKDKGAVARFGEGIIGGAKGLMAGDISAGNIMSLIPQIAAVRGAGNALLGGKVASEDKTTDMGIAALQEAIAKASQPGVAATEANTAAILQLPNAIAAATNLQGPKAPAP